jgi:pimeloyl-ACP methyl ester carboxylesterase
MKNTSDPALSTVQTTLGSIAFSDRGTGMPIILWPSLFTTHRIFDAMILPLVEAGWRTIAIDGPGFGASDPPHGLVQPETYADLIIEIADRLELPEIAFAGCSWGGLIGAHLGLRHADRVRSLVLMGTPFFPSRGGHLLPSGADEIAASTRRFRLIVERDALPLLTECFSRWLPPTAN